METDYINNHYCNESKLAIELDGNSHREAGGTRIW